MLAGLRLAASSPGLWLTAGGIPGNLLQVHSIDKIEGDSCRLVAMSPWRLRLCGDRNL